MIPRPVVTGESAYKLGDVDVQWIPIYEMNANAEARQTRQRGRTHFNNLHWFQWVVHLDRSVAKAAHPNYTGSWHMASDGMADDTRGKRYQERLQRTSGGTENDRMGYSDGAGMRLIKYDRDFFNEDVLSGLLPARAINSSRTILRRRGSKRVNRLPTSSRPASR